ncbi:type 2 lantipeptide synthetase LanM family protein [Streptomyces sp. N2-109]|uniref:Type 2 lantipeptide synthetase LanM family protein n=1 Tax=Streptomyces gossypii TaxID=2883101 RepID=A0ABT2K3M2_9ACTN|nr:type 2 lanthipeptide synthetase LanM family protein [Streptomyces gossypii]MCT2594778.1 type 2 lantipeptide synthetase LanM family protein [Streptomyces gossypii]
MTSPATYYPEFDSAEVEARIAPLAACDEEITGALRDAAPSPAAAPLDTAPRAAVDEWLGEPEEFPFQHIVRTVAAAVADSDPLGPFADLFHDPRAALRQVLDRAESRVREIWTRPLVAAVNHARAQGLLSGAGPQERYDDFVERAARTSFEEVSGLSFPVLRDVTRTVLTYEAESVRELCRRLRTDRESIARVFGIEPTDRIVSCGFSEGDVHNRGRSVSVLGFASGARLVYKPRDVSCEAAYAALARRLNDRFGTSLEAAPVLERDRYGYVEFVPTEDVSATAGEFMDASGELAAVLYLLNARDMHFENIVPTRRGPVPIDLETILHPQRLHAGPTPEAPGNAYDTLGQSLYGIGILPLVMVGKDEDAGHVDLGFLGGQGRGNSPFKTVRFLDPYTDHMRLAFQTQEGQSRQTVAGALTEDETHGLGARMAAGFSRVYRAVLADPEGWSALLREAAGGMRVRYVHNPTLLYGQTLRMTSSPKSLDGYEPYLALLKRIAIASKNSSQQLVHSELRQLARRDVPYFTVAATGVALEEGDGTPTGAEFDGSPLDLALEKAAQLSESDLGEQLRLLYSAFASRFPDDHLAGPEAATPDAAAGRRVPAPTGPALSEGPGYDGTGGGARPDLLLDSLCAQLLATSLPDKYGHLPPTWIGPSASAQVDRPWPPTVLGYDLYTGRSGPALALAAGGRVLDNAAYRDLATQVFATTADILADRKYERRSLQQAGFAGYTGLAGLLFALSAAGRLLGADDWTGAAQEALPLALDQVRGQQPDELPLDAISGLAGVLSCVLAIGGPHSDAALTELAGLLTDALRVDRNPAELAQSGCAHGISGLLAVLSRAHPRLPDGRQAVEDALARLYDRLGAFYDPGARDWFTNMASPGRFSTGWCHGTAGVALGLSAYGALAGDEDVLRQRDTAIGTMLRHGFGRNITWCHGDLGNHDILRELVRDTGDPDGRLREEIAAVESTWLTPEVFRRKLADPKSRYAHTSSLLVGTSGVALHLANRLDPGIRVSPVTLTVEEHRI